MLLHPQQLLSCGACHVVYNPFAGDFTSRFHFGPFDVERDGETVTVEYVCDDCHDEHVGDRHDSIEAKHGARPAAA